MRPDEKIARLESALDRIRRNASQPRTRANDVAAAPVLEDYEETQRIDGDDARAIVVEAETQVVHVSEPIEAIDMSEPFAEVEVEELELSEEEIVDLTEAEELPIEEIPRPHAAAAAAAVDDMALDWEELEEERPPASSRRPIAATSMDEALAEATEHIEMDEGREIPLKTPPPESGPQEAPPAYGLGASALPDIDAEPISGRESLLEFDEPPREAIEIEAPASEPPMEVREAMLEPAPESGETAPEVVRRPELRASAPSAYIAAVRGFQPRTFVELLDASLGLGE